MPLPKLLLITPPFTQLNAPYPAVPYLTGYLKSKGVDVAQLDLGILLIDKVLSKEGLKRLYSAIVDKEGDENYQNYLAKKNQYLTTVEPVKQFLRNQDPTIAYRIASEGFLPMGRRFESLAELEWTFGSLGIVDKAKYLATAYIEDLVDFIKEFVSPGFGLAKYEEQIGLSAISFSEVEASLLEPDNEIDDLMISLLENAVACNTPDLIGFTVPFPGCLFSALKCSQWIKKTHPDIRTVMGGGFVNSELRNITSKTFFEYFDFLTQEKGEIPLLRIMKYLAGEVDKYSLRRTYMLEETSVQFYDDSMDEIDKAVLEESAPDYSGLSLEKYMSILEIANPMHRLWNDGRWNKIELSHGCYWSRCKFCDTSLEYINNYETQQTRSIVDKIKSVIYQTGQTGFHFVDEAASPDVLMNLSLALLREGIQITWWANIRFENRFSEDLCRLMAQAGCIAVTGGLETANDRLLKLMNKGVTIKQAANVCSNFRNANILTHCYLMYGFPTQTRQETIDALEIVRQFFENDLTVSAFWHRFALTAHSEISRFPEKFQIEVTGPAKGDFAENELFYNEKNGFDHTIFSFGLNKAVYNFMHGIGLEDDISAWFELKTPKSSIPRNHVANLLRDTQNHALKQNIKFVIWIGGDPWISHRQDKKEQVELHVTGLEGEKRLRTNKKLAGWIVETLPKISVLRLKSMGFDRFKSALEEATSDDFESLYQSNVMKSLREAGLLFL